MPKTTLGSSKKVIVIIGMAGAGKSVASGKAEERVIPVLNCGDIIRDETQKRGLQPTAENMGKVMLKVREEEGTSVIAKRLRPSIESLNDRVVVVEGSRSLDEVDELRKHYEVVTVAIHAAPRTRFKRLLERGRSDDPKTWEDFCERDLRELSVGIGSAIALSDRVLVNEGTMAELQHSFAAVLDQLDRIWTTSKSK